MERKRGREEERKREKETERRRLNGVVLLLSYSEDITLSRHLIPKANK